MKAVDYYDLRIESIQCCSCSKHVQKGVVISTTDGGKEIGYQQYCLECALPADREAWEVTGQKISSLDLPLGTASVID